MSGRPGGKVREGLTEWVGYSCLIKPSIGIVEGMEGDYTGKGDGPERFSANGYQPQSKVEDILDRH
jgi:hypothetical protein